MFYYRTQYHPTCYNYTQPWSVNKDVMLVSVLFVDVYLLVTQSYNTPSQYDVIFCNLLHMRYTILLIYEISIIAYYNVGDILKHCPTQCICMCVDVCMYAK